MSLRNVFPLVASAIVAASAPRDVYADERPNVIAGHLGLGSAVGELGASYTRQLGGRFALEGGVGLGITGLNLSIMPKLTFGGGANRFVAGVGVSASGGGRISGEQARILWLNADVLGYERRTLSGWVFSISGGLTYAILSSLTCPDAIPCPSRGTIFPQARLGVGRSF